MVSAVTITVLVVTIQVYFSPCIQAGLGLLWVLKSGELLPAVRGERASVQRVDVRGKKKRKLYKRRS